MVIVEIVYVIVMFFVFQVFSVRVGKWARANGINGPEKKAKMFAFAWRGSEVAASSAIIYVLWEFLLQLGIHGPWTVRGGQTAFWIAVIFTVLFGGLYIGGSLFGAVTIPMGNQVEYFNDIDAKMKAEGLG